MKYLAIGGPLDGDYIDSEDHAYHHDHVRESEGTDPVRLLSGKGADPMDETQSFERVLYLRASINFGDGVQFSFYVIDSEGKVSPQRIISLLSAGYRVPFDE